MGGPMADNDTETHPIDPPLEVAIPIPSGSTNFFKGLEETSSSSLFYPPLYPHRTPSINPPIGLAKTCYWLRSKGARWDD